MLAKLAVVPRKIQKRRQHSFKVPWAWVERLHNRQLHGYLPALLYRHWKDSGEPFLLSNAEVTSAYMH